jgi:hypothetical protein
LRPSGRKELEYTWTINGTPDDSRCSADDFASEFHDEFRSKLHYRKLPAEFTIVEFDRHFAD